LKAIVKPQYVDRIPKAIRGPDKTVRTLIEGNASLDNTKEVLDVLGKALTQTNMGKTNLTGHRIEPYHGP
jgi:translation initiation factor RLI1